jgi:hypothetical protein
VLGLGVVVFCEVCLQLLAVLVVVRDGRMDLGKVEGGYRSRICASPRPCLRRATTSTTEIRVSSMQAFPPRTPGCFVMWEYTTFDAVAIASVILDLPCRGWQRATSRS